ncbi:DUF7296 family protein [Sphingobacterium sp.]|uniref:DUF7296 family protein n=1 Tax=Sphingobacterium sp. TaxID=341027 RepID=UPI002FDB581E
MKREIETKLFEFTQNNSGGSFDVDENVCHRVVIEAVDKNHAMALLEPMVEHQSYSCSCCGDRWSPCYGEELDIAKYKEEGLLISIYTHYKDYEQRWHTLFGDLPRKTDPTVIKRSWGDEFGTLIFFEDEIQYLQYLANQYGWTTPDVRIHYLDGSKKEIFKVEIHN